MKTILAFVTLHTADYARARPFFVDVLGFEPTEERAGATAFVSASGAGLAVREVKDAPPAAASTVYFIVPDVKKYHAEVVARGAQVAEPLHDMPFGQTFTVQTPDGHWLGFYEA